MGTKRSFAAKAVGIVVAGFLAMGMTAGPADAASRTASGSGVVKVARDSGWDAK